MIRQPSPLGRACRAARVFFSPSATGEGSVSCDVVGVGPPAPAASEVPRRGTKSLAVGETCGPGPRKEKYSTPQGSNREAGRVPWVSPTATDLQPLRGWGCGLWLDQAFLDSEQNQFRRAVEVERFHDTGAVHGDGINADIKKRSNFLIGFALSDQL